MLLKKIYQVLLEDRVSFPKEARFTSVNQQAATLKAANTGTEQNPTNLNGPITVPGQTGTNPNRRG